MKSIFITVALLFFSIGSYASDYVGLECKFSFDGRDWKNIFIVDMENGISEMKFTQRDGSTSGKTNLETIVAPNQITINEPTALVNLIHRISRQTLDYERQRISRPAMGIKFNDTELGKCEVVKVDTSNNKF